MQSPYLFHRYVFFLFQGTGAAKSQSHISSMLSFKVGKEATLNSPENPENQIYAGYETGKFF